MGALAAGAAFRHFVRLGRLLPTGRQALEAAAGSGDPERVGAALGALFPSGWSPVLAEGLLVGTGRVAAVAELNEHLHDIENELVAGRHVPSAAARIAAFAGAFGAIVELTKTVGVEQPNYGPAAAALVLGAIFAVVSAEIGRRSRLRVGEVRSEWDRVATVFARRLEPILPNR
jgi:hypothetical protein